MFAIAEKQRVEIHMYTDNTLLYIPFNPGDYEAAIAKLEACKTETNRCLAGNHFKLNDDKTEFVIIRQNTLTQKITGSKSIVIGNATIST